MLITRFAIGTLWLGLAAVAADVASAQEFPTKPIRIVTGSPGGSGDFSARVIAQGISGLLGQPAIVENRPSAITADVVAKSPPDGYTLLVFNNILWTMPLIRNASYDAVRDFLPISLTNRQPNVLIIHPSLPVRSVKELIALAKARPGDLNYGSSSAGGTTQLAAELFKSMAGVNIVRIPYKGGGVALNDLLGGQVQMMFSTAAVAAPHVKSGRLRALAVTSAEPSELFPGLPAVATSGLPGYESVAMTGLFAPAKTPAVIISRLNQETVRALKQADVREKFLNAGVETVGSSPEEFAAAIKSDIARISKVIKEAGIID